MLTKKVLMNNAWTLAHKGAKRFGGNAREYFAESLKIAWMLYKQLKAKKGDIVGIAPWFIKKNFGHLSMIDQINNPETPLKIKKSTQKAHLVEVAVLDNRKVVVDRFDFWAPKSVCI